MKKILKWVGMGLASIIVLVAILVFVISSKGRAALNQTYTVTADLLSETPMDSLSLARGRHLSKIHGCQECHGHLYQGMVMIDAPPFRAVPANLTPGIGGVGSKYTTSDWDRSIRYGVKPDGRALIIMPAKTLHNLTDEDAASLIAFLKTLDPVDNELPVTEVRLLGSIMAGAGALDAASEVHTIAQRAAVNDMPTIEDRGKYLASILCIYCHGENLRGGPPREPSMPPPPDLAAASAWPFESFEQALRTGVTPANHQMESEFMPWQSFKNMTEAELRAIYAHLQTIRN